MDVRTTRSVVLPETMACITLMISPPALFGKPVEIAVHRLNNTESVSEFRTGRDGDQP